MKRTVQKALALLLCAAVCFTGLIGCEQNATAPTPSPGAPEPSQSGDAQSSATGVNAATCENIADYLDYDSETTYLKNYCSMAILRGSWYEMGIQYAQQCPDAIKRNIADKLGANLAAWGGFENMYEAIPEYEAMLEFFPGYLEFCHGIAEGLGIAYEDVVVSMLALGTPEDACAAASAWGSATGTGEVYAAIHSDSPHQANYFHPGIIAYPEDGNAFISLTGFTNGYMNDKGLVSMITYGGANAEGDITNGLPICIGALYNAAYSNSASEAVDAHIEKCRVGSGEIAHYTDAGGDAYLLETTAGHYGVRQAGDFGEEDFLCQTNGYWTEEMQSSDDDYVDNVYRYDSIFKYLNDHVGHITIDVLREALSNTSYYDKATDQWTYEWDMATGDWSPECKAPRYGCAMRRVFNLTTKTVYALMGSEHDLVSKVPYSLGTYSKITLDENPSTTLANSATELRLQLWYASRDIEAARAAGEDVTLRMEYFDTARETLYQGTNYQAIGLVAMDENEQLTHYAAGLSLLNKGQCYAKAAQSGDIADLIDG